MRATSKGSLVPLGDCEIIIPGLTNNQGKIPIKALPDISDNKNAIYNSEPIMGRSFPLYTYSHSGDRTINMQLHFFVVDDQDQYDNLQYLRWLQSAVYPRDDATPYRPPPVCQIRCGQLLATDYLCVIMQSYSVKFPTEVAWAERTYCPYRFDVDLTWLVVYDSADLPWHSRIWQSGR